MRRFGGSLYFWVLVAMVAGTVVGTVNPALGVSLKPLGDGFIKLVKMLITPIVFSTVVLGIVSARDMKKVGRVGVKTIVYFEVVTTIALAIGMFIGNTIRPGDGFNVDPATLDPNAVAGYARAAEQQTTIEFLLAIIPATFTDAFTGNGSLLQVLFVAILFGYAITRLGLQGGPVHRFVEELAHVFFAMMNFLMKAAPIGAFGAIAFTVGQYGIESFGPLAKLMGTYYLTCFVFVVGVLGTISLWAGFNLFRFIAYIKDEVLTVLGTASSESALIPLMQKLEKLGCSKAVVGLVVPSGMSFNMDGTSIYVTMGALFVAQALNIELSLMQQITLFGVAMITSKGAAGIAGASFITLAGTLAVVPTIPVAGLALILGIDRFMAEIRTATNFVGNGVAAIVVSRWEGDLDTAKLRQELGGVRGGGSSGKPEGHERVGIG
jgi:aerobic C4-dicarboxylate transport protein